LRKRFYSSNGDVIAIALCDPRWLKNTIACCRRIRRRRELWRQSAGPTIVRHLQTPAGFGVRVRIMSHPVRIIAIFRFFFFFFFFVPEFDIHVPLCLAWRR